MAQFSMTSGNPAHGIGLGCPSSASRVQWVGAPMSFNLELSLGVP